MNDNNQDANGNGNFQFQVTGPIHGGVRIGRTGGPATDPGGCCPTCKEPISPRAESCPECGHPVGKERIGRRKLIAALGLLTAIAVSYSLWSPLIGIPDFLRDLGFAMLAERLRSGGPVITLALGMVSLAVVGKEDRR